MYTIPNLDDECKNASQHDNKLEHIRPDDGFYPALKENNDKWGLQTHYNSYYKNLDTLKNPPVFVKYSKTSGVQ